MITDSWSSQHWPPLQPHRQAWVLVCAGTYGDQPAALKLLILDEDTAHAILNEVRLCLKLSHKNLVQLLDCAVVATKKQPTTPGCQVRAWRCCGCGAPESVDAAASHCSSTIHAWLCWLVCSSGCGSALAARLWMAYCLRPPVTPGNAQSLCTCVVNRNPVLFPAGAQQSRSCLCWTPPHSASLWSWQ